MATIKSSVGAGGKNLAPDVTLVQTMLRRHKEWLNILDVPEVTGKCDRDTRDAIKSFQARPGALLEPDGVVSPRGFTLRWLGRLSIPSPAHRIFATDTTFSPGRGIPADSYASAAAALGCEAAAIEAVAQVETMRDSYDGDGKPTILFERHRFHHHTGGEFDSSHPDICNKHAGGYGLFSEQYPKLSRAALLDEAAALMSASWGMFQIMGEYFTDAGFSSVADFVDAMLIGEQRHLDAFVALINARPAAKIALQDRDWASFALHYNGTGYASNQYDTKMAAAYAALTAPPPKKKVAP